MATQPGPRRVPHGRLPVRGVSGRRALPESHAPEQPPQQTTDWAEFRCPCGCTLGLLIWVDARRCDGFVGECLPARDVARLLLREWHREDLPSERPA